MIEPRARILTEKISPSGLDAIGHADGTTSVHAFSL